MSDWDFLYEMNDRGYSAEDIAGAAACGYAPWEEKYITSWISDLHATGCQLRYRSDYYPQRRVHEKGRQGRLTDPGLPPVHADGGHFGYDLPVTQDTRAACRPSPGTLSAMGMESLSAISGMCKLHFLGARSRQEGGFADLSLTCSP